MAILVVAAKILPSSSWRRRMWHCGLDSAYSAHGAWSYWSL